MPSIAVFEETLTYLILNIYYEAVHDTFADIRTPSAVAGFPSAMRGDVKIVIWGPWMAGVAIILDRKL